MRVLAPIGLLLDCHSVVDDRTDPKPAYCASAMGFAPSGMGGAYPRRRSLLTASRN